jgi:hypothetical protein
MTPSEWKIRMNTLTRTRYPPWESLDDLVTENEPVSTWEDFQQWCGKFGSGWCFRGHWVASWPLISSLERQRRLVKAERGDRIHEIYQPFDARVHESSLLTKFQRGAPEYQDSEVDSLAMMQHYGTPTRYLDWTRCPFRVLNQLGSINEWRCKKDCYYPISARRRHSPSVFWG